MGTRLQRYSSVLTADDGTQVTAPSYLYRDTILNMDCAFQIAADGKQRCLPSSTAGDIATSYGWQTLFSDSNCSKKLYYAVKQCPSVKYLFLATYGPGCPAPTQYTVYSMHSTVTPTALYSGAPGSCSSVGDISSYLSTYTFFDLSGTAPMSPSQFVGGTTTQVL